MKFFLDSTNIDEISKAADLGLVDGVTTNPSLIAKSGSDTVTVISQIADIINGDISAEVFANDYDNILREAEILYNISQKIVLKLPLTKDGLKACKFFSSQGKKTNVTLCFSAAQALLAAKAGATYISPFIGRLDDAGEDGIQLIYDIKDIYNNYNFDTKILAASIRSSKHIIESAIAGADFATLSFKILEELYYHELTDKGLEIFNKDASKVKPLI